MTVHNQDATIRAVYSRRCRDSALVTTILVGVGN